MKCHALLVGCLLYAIGLVIPMLLVPLDTSLSSEPLITILSLIDARELVLQPLRAPTTNRFVLNLISRRAITLMRTDDVLTCVSADVLDMSQYMRT